MAQNFLSDIKLGDSIYIRLGDSTNGDFRMQHNGTNMFMDNHTGNIYIRNYSDDKNIHFQTDNGSGGITDYIVIHGTENVVKFKENSKHLDSIEARFGTSSDMVLYHDGSHSFIRHVGTGNLYIDQTQDDQNIVFRNDDGSGGIENYFIIDGGSERNIFYKTIRINGAGAGYLKTDVNGDVSIDTSTIEDTLQTVTDRGSTTTNDITLDDNTTESPFIAYVDSSDIEYRTYNSSGNLLLTRINNSGADFAINGHATDYTQSTFTFAGQTLSASTITNWNTAYNHKINSASFSTANGVLTLTRESSGTVTVDLDGRYPTFLSHVLQLSNGELSSFNGSMQMVVDANDGDSNVPAHGDYAGSYPYGIYFTGDNDLSGTTLGTGLVKVWHTGHFTKTHIDYFVGLYDTGVTTTEYDYLDGVTSNIQTQLDSKLSSESDTLDSVTGRGATTTNAITTGDITISADTPELFFTDTDNNVDAKLIANNGNLGIFADTNNERSDSTIYFNIDGDEKARFTSDGELGIGTGTGVDEKLHVQGSVNNDDIAIKIENTFDDDGASSAPASALLFAAASNNGYIRLTGSPSDDASQHNFEIGSTATGSFITLKPSGGTALTLDSSQNATFEGDVTVGGGNIEVDSSMSSSPTSIIYLDVDGTNADGGGGSIVFSTSASAGTLTDYNAQIRGVRASGGDGGDSQLEFYTTLVSDQVTPQRRMLISKEGDVTFDNDITVEGGHQKILVGTYSNYAQTTDRLYIGGDGLASQDAAIYIGNRGNDTGYGYRIYYEGTGTGNDNKLILKSENNGTNVDMLSFTADGEATFGGNIIPSADSTHDIGSSSVRWANIYTDAISVLGQGTFDTINTGQGATEVHLMNQNVRTTDNVEFGDVNVTGNLTVTGTSTTVNVEDLNVEQGEITLNYGTGDTSATANGSGIRIQDAVDASTDATILWDKTNAQFDFNQKVHVTASGSILLLLENSATSGADSKIRIRGARNAQTYSDGSLLSSVIFSNHDSDDTTVNHDLGEIGVGMYDASGNTGYLRLKVNNGSGLQTAIDIDKNLDAKFEGKVGIGGLDTTYNLYNNGTSYFNDEVYVNAQLRMTNMAAGLTYAPQENGNTQNRYFIMFDNTNDASYPFLTNRTPSGAVVIKTGTAAAGGENEHFRIKGGDGTVDAYFTNANLGLGTSSPDSILEVNYDDSTSLENNTASGITIKNENSSGGATITFSHTDSNSTGVVAKIGAINDSSTTDDNGILTFSTRKIGVGMSRHMTIDSDGLVGIGNTSPDTKLHITDTSSAFQFTADTGTAGDGRLNIGHFANGTFIGTYGDDGGAADLIRFGTHSGDERMRIASDGTITLNAYGAGHLKTDANGVISVDTSVVDGSGTANDVVMWSDSNTVTDAPISISGNDATFEGDINLYTTGATDTNKINLPRSGFITFYGDNSKSHSISSRNSSGSIADDLRINTYGALYINLDSNNNNTSGADFMIGRHGGQEGNISDTFLTINGETGDATFEGDVITKGKIRDYDTKTPNQNLLDIDSIKISNRNDIYDNVTKTVINDYKATYANDDTGSTTVRLYVDDGILVDGDTYMVSVYYEGLVGSLSVDFADEAVTGNGTQTGTSAIPTSGRIWGYASRSSYGSGYRFFDINLTQGSGHTVTLFNPKVEAGTVLTDFVATERTNLEANSKDFNNVTATGELKVYDDATIAGDVTVDNKLNFTGTSYQISGGSSVGDMRFVAPRFRFYEDTISGAAKLEIDGGNATFAGVLDVNGTSNSNFYALELERSGSSTTTPDIWGTNNVFVIGTSSSNDVISLSNSDATFAGDVTVNGGDITVNTTGKATLTLNGDSDNSGDAAVLDSEIKMLHDAGDYGILLQTQNHSGRSSFKIVEKITTTETMRFQIDETGDATFSGEIIGNSDITTTNGLIKSTRTGANMPSSSNANLYLVDSRSMTNDVGGSIVFGGVYNGSGDIISGGPFIKGYKENNTAGDYGFGLKFAVRENGSGAITDPCLTLNSSGNATFAGSVSVNAAGQKALLHVKNEGNNWEDSVLLEHDSGNTGWNIHPENNSDNALWFGYNSDTSVALTSQAATTALKLNSDLSANFEGEMVVGASNMAMVGIEFSITNLRIKPKTSLANGRIFRESNYLIYDSPSDGHKFAVAGNASTNVALTIDSSQNATFAGQVETKNNAGIYSFSDTVNAGSSEDIFTLSNSHGAQAFRVTFVCNTSGFSVAKTFEVVHQFAGTPVFAKVVDTGAYSNNDFTVAFANDSDTGIKCTITNSGATINADIVTTVFLGGSPTDITVTEL